MELVQERAAGFTLGDLRVQFRVEAADLTDELLLSGRGLNVFDDVGALAGVGSVDYWENYLSRVAKTV